ncbi:DM13 domain-containing protein [Actinoplanes sp. NPDC049118]|uniref:DM13 domain-containing protein n=1 Tax=Actinoplanes sp. NPDC049118 TaxID=3155769 RepID=UPI003405AB62
MTNNLFASLARRRVTWLVLAAGAVVVAVVLPLFQPWKLWVDETVDEPPPAAAAAASGTASAGPRAAAGPATIARGTFESHEHDTTGAVRVVRDSDGARYLRIEDLDTSNGPALKVWLTDAPVLTGRDGWHVFDDGRHVDLGALKGNKGSQNYPIPAGVDLAAYRSVSIWCARFRVSFGAAPLTN